MLSYHAASNQKNVESDYVLLSMASANTINVLLGFGINWTGICLYHFLIGNDLPYTLGKMATEEISFILLTFIVLAVIAVLVLVLRRVTVGGELGGP